MTSIEKTGTSIEAIIAAFRGEHRIKDWELKYDIVKKPSKGLFGLFANKTAIVRFELPTIGERAANFLSQLLNRMGIPFNQVLTKTEGKTVYLEIRGSEDSGLLIGKNGYMLETLQFLVNRVYETERDLDRIFLDVDGYRERREAQFLRQFQPLIKKVREQGKPQTLEPLNSTDRRVIHRHIERDRGLRTLTIGEGEMKRIVIFSSKQKESEALSQAQGGKENPALPKNRKPTPKAGPEHGSRPEQNPRHDRRPRPKSARSGTSTKQ
ncbi:MAG: Jag N-terminal domain-containing protein [Candidatus Cloacimonetes bacterium]|nr:Jag N-terminal domain-containing protein [Candidatus Cloacimonadota bacterium]